MLRIAVLGAGRIGKFMRLMSPLTVEWNLSR